MKKLLSTLFLALTLGTTLVACQEVSLDVESSEPNNSVSVFRGVISEINGDSAIVTPNDDQEHILSSGDKVSVDLSKSTTTFALGDEIVVYYTGDIMESDPLQVVVTDIERVLEDDVVTPDEDFLVAPLE